VRRLTFFYRYYVPDSVVSAVLYSQLAEHFSGKGYSVRVVCANRCMNGSQQLPAREVVNGVEVIRLWQPAFSSSIFFLRCLGVLWTLASFMIWKSRQRFAEDDSVIIGSDPPFLAMLSLQGFGAARVFHWIFDLYPDAAIADGILASDGLFARLARSIMRRSITNCEPVSLSECMTDRLIRRWNIKQPITQISPWAQNEPTQIDREQFKSTAEWGLLYSGSFGRAHRHVSLPDLIRSVQTADVKVTFSIPDIQKLRLTSLIGQGLAGQVSFQSQVSQSDIVSHLQSFRVHLITLAEGWEGVVLPSKFFGVLAAGRPVFFLGGQQASIARWINHFDIGWTTDGSDIQQVVKDMLRLTNDSTQFTAMCSRCSDVYNLHFSSEIALSKWEKLLD
jgi:colanic acid biosynthesis glycosyl transferase WcaI